MSTLLTPEYLGRLERLVTLARAAAATPTPGRRPGVGKGASVEFVDYREYQPGDDLRYVDWNAYRRMGRLFLRLFRAESELALHILLDVSRSMRYGRYDKLDFARRVAAALAFVGVSNLDRVSLATFSDHLHSALPPARSRPHLLRIFETLEEVLPEGKSDINRALREYGDYARQGGMAVILSDCFDPAGAEEGLGYLGYRRFEVSVIHILADEEVEPDVSSPLELRDLEDETAPGVQADPASVAGYRERLDAFRRSLETFCMENGMHYVPASSSASFDEWVYEFLRRGIWHAQ